MTREVAKEVVGFCITDGKGLITTCEVRIQKDVKVNVDFVIFLSFLQFFFFFFLSEKEVEYNLKGSFNYHKKGKSYLLKEHFMCLDLFLHL